MAYTLVAFERPFTDAENASMNTYLLDEVATGNTDGIGIPVIRVGLTFLQNGALYRRTWKTVEAANAFVAFCEGFSPAPTFTQVIVFGDPGEWVGDIVAPTE